MVAQMGWDPKVWEDPIEFKPERFMVREDDDKRRIMMEVRGQNYNILPFGSGRRGCPGASLALDIFHTALASMIQCFEWKRASEEEIDMAEGVGITMPKVVPLEAMCKARYPVINKL